MAAATNMLFGETSNRVRHGAMLDEGLDVVDALWSGEKVDHAGRYYTVRGVMLTPGPLQRPRIPVWVGGNSPPALRRAARWGGWIADSVDPHRMKMKPEDVAAKVALIRSCRREGAPPLEVAIEGYSRADRGPQIGEYEQAGMTWWFEMFHDMRGDFDQMMQRVGEGPPS